MDNRTKNIKNDINNCVNNNDITKSSLIFLYIWMIIINFIIIGNEIDDIYIRILLIIFDLILNSFIRYYWGLAFAKKIYIQITIYRFITYCFSFIFAI